MAAADTSAPFGAVLTAMVTPFTDSGSVDYAAVGALADDLVALGNDGLVVNGTTGESPTTSDDEKRRILQTVVEAVDGRVKVVAGVGSNNTEHTLALAEQAQAVGADGLLVVTPYYNKPPQPALLRHFRTVADAADLPIMLYDIPGRTGTAISTDTLLALAEHPRIVANKDAKGDPYRASMVMANSDLAYYSGDDGLNLALLAYGATGFVSVIGHLVADRLVDMRTKYLAGDVVGALAVHRTLIPLVDGIMTKTQGVVAVKAALEMLGRPGGGMLRAPLYPADEHFRIGLAKDLGEGGVAL